jgi:hypothetical protein
MVARIGERLQVALPLRDLFAAPTIAQIAETVRDFRAEKRSRRLERIESAGEGEEHRLSYAQSQLWFIHQSLGTSSAYHIPIAICLEGALDVYALARGLNQALQQHDALRSSFRSKKGMPSWSIRDFTMETLPIVDLSAIPKEERDEAARIIMVECSRRKFDLERDLLLRSLLLRLGTEQFILILVVHHIVCDGRSIEVLLEDLSAAYQSKSSHIRKLPPEDQLCYADFVAWQCQRVESGELDSQRDYWMRQLHGAPESCTLRPDYDRPPFQTFSGRTLNFAVYEDTSKALQHFCQNESITEFVALLAGLKALLSHYLGSNDIVVGTAFGNRTHPDLQDLVGFLVNSVPLRTRITPNWTFRQLASAVNKIVLAAHANQEYPFPKLVETLHRERIPGINPIFQVMFLLQRSNPSLHLEGVVASPLSIDTGHAQFDFSIQMHTGAQGIRGAVQFNSDMYRRSTILSIIEAYQHLLKIAFKNPDESLSSLTADLPEAGAMAEDARRTAEASSDDLGREEIRHRRERIRKRRSELSDEQKNALERRLRGE